MLTAVSLSFLADSVDYMIKFHYFFQTTYRAYMIHRYKKICAEGPTTVLEPNGPQLAGDLTVF